MQYRRADIKGGTYFFTVNLAKRQHTLLADHIHGLWEAILAVKGRHPFRLDALVVLPDHLHAIMTLPPGDNRFPTRWRLIKANFSQRVPRLEKINSSRKSKGERGLWQRRYWEHLIRSDLDYHRHVDYIHYNPVKHGYVKKPGHWPYSGIHGYIAKGLLSADWGADEAGGEISCGERD